MKPTPAGWPRISTSLIYDDPKSAIDWLCRAFGFEVRIKVESDAGAIEHSELLFGEGVIMVSGEKPGRAHLKAPKSVGGANTQALFVYVDDVDAHCKRARDAGATITREPTNIDYGAEHWEDRSYGCTDVGGHTWSFAQRVRSPAK